MAQHCRIKNSKGHYNLKGSRGKMGTGIWRRQLSGECCLEGADLGRGRCMQPPLVPTERGQGEETHWLYLLFTEQFLLFSPIGWTHPEARQKRSHECSPYRLALQDTEHDREGDMVSLKGQMKDFQPRYLFHNCIMIRGDNICKSDQYWHIKVNIWKGPMYACEGYICRRRWV